jgi:uncharacterized damage-inducible protein DinB
MIITYHKTEPHKKFIGAFLVQNVKKICDHLLHVDTIWLLLLERGDHRLRLSQELSRVRHFCDVDASTRNDHVAKEGWSLLELLTNFLVSALAQVLYTCQQIALLDARQ